MSFETDCTILSLIKPLQKRCSLNNKQINGEAFFLAAKLAFYWDGWGQRCIICFPVHMVIHKAETQNFFFSFSSSLKACSGISASHVIPPHPTLFGTNQTVVLTRSLHLIFFFFTALFFVFHVLYKNSLNFYTCNVTQIFIFFFHLVNKFGKQCFSFFFVMKR